MFAPPLPQLDAAGVDGLDGVALGRVQQPAGVVAQAIPFAGGDQRQRIFVVAEEDEEALVEDRRVVEFFVGVAGGEGRDGGVEHGRVAHAGVQVAGRERARRAADRAGAEAAAARVRGTSTIFGPHLAGVVDLRPGDVGVHVDAAGHHDQPRRVEDAIRGVGRGGDDLSVARPHVADDAIDAVGRVVYRAAGDLQQGHAMNSIDDGSGAASARRCARPGAARRQPPGVRGSGAARRQPAGVGGQNRRADAAPLPHENPAGGPTPRPSGIDQASISSSASLSALSMISR